MILHVPSVSVADKRIVCLTSLGKTCCFIILRIDAICFSNPISRSLKKVIENISVSLGLQFGQHVIMNTELWKYVDDTTI